MHNQLFVENFHMAIGLAPVADAFSGTVASDVVNMRDHGSVVFLINIGVGTTGTSTITVEACDDVTPSNTTAIPFWYRQNTTNDTQGTITAATTSGFTTTAGSNKLIAVEVRSEDLAASGYKYVRLKAVESANDPVLGGITILLGNPRYGQSAALRSEIV